MSETFKEKLCRHLGIPAEHFGETVLRRTLYPHARWLPLLKKDDWLAPDRNFVADVGRLTRWRDFAEVAREFQQEPRNRLFRRRSLRLRVSVSRMRELFASLP